MPLQTVQSVPVEYPEIPFNAIRFDLNVANGHIGVRLYRCRVLPGDVWQDMPGQQPVTACDAPELSACLPAISAGVASLMGTDAPFILNVISRIEAGGELAATVNIFIPSTRVSRQIANIYAASQPAIQAVLPQVMAGVDAANQRLGLL